MQACVNSDLVRSYEFGEPRRAGTTIHLLAFPASRITVTPSHGKLHVLDATRGAAIAVVEVPRMLFAAAEALVNADSKQEKEAAQASLEAAWGTVVDEIGHWFRYQ